MRKQAEDLVGKRFGRLVAVQGFPNYKNNHTYYLCKCDCGNEKIIYEYTLKNGESTSCGCKTKNKGFDKYREYIGRHVNSLTILNVFKSKRIYFECKCDCGEITKVEVLRLLNNKTTSCGKCRHVEHPTRRKDIVGNKYGMLTIVEMLYRFKGKNTYCRCLCDCGNETIAHCGNIKRGLSKSCGCLERDSRYNRNHIIDIIGKKYGKLTVIKSTGDKESNQSAIWECQCECGKIINVSASDLRRFTSCGCEYNYGASLDLTGKKFGSLVVREQINSRYRNGIWWRCECLCGKSVTANSRDLVEGRRSSCGCRAKSTFEELVADVLDENNIKYVRQQTFDDCVYKHKLRFDFYLKEHNLLIEADGQQHHTPVSQFGGVEGYKGVVKRDSIKNHYCKLNNINLLRINYTLNKQSIQQQIYKYIDPVTITG
jgi:hypothetical protein